MIYWDLLEIFLALPPPVTPSIALDSNLPPHPMKLKNAEQRLLPSSQIMLFTNHGVTRIMNEPANLEKLEN